MTGGSGNTVQYKIQKKTAVFGGTVPSTIVHGAFLAGASQRGSQDIVPHPKTAPFQGIFTVL